MKKPNRLKKGDKIAIVSLSSGVLGEEFVKHEVELVEKRLKELGLTFEYMPNAKKGMEYLAANPEAKAEDLKQAFLDKSVKAIWCAIGGVDTFRTLPSLMNEEFKEIVRKNPKIFIGFSDTTNNHLMLYQMGLSTYYGPALLPDLAEFSPEMLPYTKSWIKELFNPTAEKEIKDSPVWYVSRKSFGPEMVGVPAEERPEQRGIQFIGAKKKVSGRLLGGCIDSLYEMIVCDRFEDQAEVFKKYPIFPEAEEWKGKILFIETSEEQPEPGKYRKMIAALEEKKVFENVAGVLVGKPMDEKYIDDYQAILIEVAEKYGLVMAFNLNFGHGAPRMILPYGQKVEIDAAAEKVKLLEPMVK